MHIAYCATYMPDFKAIGYFNEGMVNALSPICSAAGARLSVIAPHSSRNRFAVDDDRFFGMEGNPFVYESFYLPGLLEREQVDVAIFPNNRIPNFTHGKFKKAVVVHDLLFWRYPKKFDPVKYNFRNINLKNALQKADLIITVSRFCASELKAFGCKKDIIVCGEGVPVGNLNQKPDAMSINHVRTTFGLDKPYFLFVGTQAFQRNLGELLLAFQKVSRLNNDYMLVIAGGKNKNHAQLVEKKIAELQLGKRIIITGEVNESQKAALIKGAEVLMLPSIYEGFGLQMLEAFHYGTPVIASNVGALPEVAGDAAYLTTPDSEALAQAMMSVISYPNIRRMLIENGYDRLLLYSWEKAARLVWQALQSERLIL